VPIRLRIPRRQQRRGRRTFDSWFADPVVRVASTVFVVLAVAMIGVFTYYYVKYDRIIDRRMSGQIFSNAAKIYARAQEVRVGDKASVEQIAARLRRAGYSESGDSRIGTFKLRPASITIEPGPESYHSPEGAVVRVENGKVQKILTTDKDQESLTAYELEPQVVTALFEGEQRSKRRLITYDELPKMLVDAVLAIEDRRFLQHRGVNYFRLAEAVWIDLWRGRGDQGGSTLTMQIARGFFLTPKKTIKRKLAEILIAVQLERRFSKPKIFELYANQVYMGQRGSFTIAGFGEASQAYFGKDIKHLTLPEAALLAAIIQRPNFLSPYKNPERALERRNLVLEAMVDTGTVTRAEADRAKAAPLKLAPPNVEASDAPYFVDLVKDLLVARVNERELNEQAYRIYTTLDPDLQHAAAEAVAEGIKAIDARVKTMRTRKRSVGKGKNARVETTVLAGPMPQVALVAIDPHTGDVLALVGGRNYGFSQLNHAVARRPTGSIFKPFVYAAAMNTAVSGEQPVFTPASTVDDAPTTFMHGDEIYEPRNYKEQYRGQVTVRFALALSLNNATVKVAETVGYDKVAALARAAGIKSVQATPAAALGSYDATPLDMASAYTVFANGGARLGPLLVRSVRDAKGGVLHEFQSQRQPVLDPRVAYVMTSMMEAVLNSGTGVGVRARGFSAPAAGKTGTSHDGWFAGYTTNLLCIVWVGYDDYSDLRLSGAETAAPIWADFMKKAIALPEYRDAKSFAQPGGVVDVRLDKVTNRLATATCPDDYTAAFIAGTEPRETCDQLAADQQGFFSRLLGLSAKPLPPPPVSSIGQPQQRPPAAQSGQAEESAKKKKGFFGKVLGVFKGEEKDEQQQQPPPSPPPPPRAPQPAGDGRSH
jgi:penicillin-binding protein 1B